MALIILRSVRAYSTKARPKLLGIFKNIPCELFRINATKAVKLRDHGEQLAKGRSSYDLYLDKEGFVLPSPNNGKFERPNGMSVRPNGPLLQEIIREFKGKNVTIYKLPQGLDLESKELVCLWEHSDHYSVQTTKPIKLDALNMKLTKMCQEEGERMSKDEFLQKYPFEESY